MFLSTKASGARRWCGVAIANTRSTRSIGHELISLFALAVAKHLTMADLASFVAPHPTLGEIYNRLAEAWEKEQAPSPGLARRLKLQRMLP